MRPIRWRLATRALRQPRRCLAVAWCAPALVGALSLVGHAGQLRSVTEGVYSSGQAARGQQMYEAQCAQCHGRKGKLFSHHTISYVRAG